jgi:hypothetical protein
LVFWFAFKWAIPNLILQNISGEIYVSNRIATAIQSREILIIYVLIQWIFYQSNIKSRNPKLRSSASILIFYDFIIKSSRFKQFLTTFIILILIFIYSYASILVLGLTLRNIFFYWDQSGFENFNTVRSFQVLICIPGFFKFLWHFLV